jgi:flagellar biosynthesis/type III secretory pathway protein FliH
MEVLLMPSEEYIRDLESNRIFHSYGYDEGYKDGYKKGYEDGKVLDEIRAEIEQSYCTVDNDYDRGRNYGLYIATQIIDKYKAESEE